jgi:hypothetical protein
VGFSQPYHALVFARPGVGAKVAACDAADESPKTFAHTAVAAQVRCSWCLELQGEDVLELVAIGVHRGAPISQQDAVLGLSLLATDG